MRFAFRIFLKDKFFSILNVLGLALGIAVSIILMLILKNDLSYDKHYANHERIYRLGSHFVIPDVDEYIGAAARELTPVLKQNYPEIEEIVRIDHIRRQLVKADNGKKFFEERIEQTDPNYFKIFSHHFIAGDVNTCLKDPKSVVITRSTAKKYFDNEDALGKMLTIKKEPRIVTAVIEDFPANTHLKFDFLISGLTENRPGWDYEIVNGKPEAIIMWNPDVLTYMLLPENYDVNNFYDRFKPIYEEYFTGHPDWKPTDKNEPVLQPLAEVHFSRFDEFEEYKALIVFATIGALIVLLACINYMNLATAKAIRRATEITMRRLSGAGKTRLVLSLLSEAVLLALISFVIATGVVYIVIEPVNTLINKQLSLGISGVIASLPIALIIGILSGIYPAFYLTNIPVIESLKGKLRSGSAGLFLRKTLITVQFCISIFVVACTLFMGDQMQFIRTKSLGFNKDNMLVVPMQDTIVSNELAVIKNELAKDSRIIGAAASAQVIGMGEGVEMMYVEGPNGIEQRGFVTLWVDDDYLEIMGIEVIHGRSFAEGKGIDTDGVYIANEAAVKMMEWGDNAIGKKAAFFGHQNEGQVIGVIKDFNASSLHLGVDPMLIIKGHWRPGYLNIKLNGNDIPGAVEHVKKIFAKIDTEHPFEYFFLDEKYDSQYKSDVVMNKLLSVLSYVCVFISLLGLLGLSAFAAVQRTKEIGIRKVLGANIAGILVLLSKDILLLVILAATIVAPLSWYVMNEWLDGFAYRAPLNYVLLLAIALSSMAFVFIVTALQSWRTATANPVESLKYE
jgi:putative ABC transport system permease protein